jgi:hypothetical protein
LRHQESCGDTQGCRNVSLFHFLLLQGRSSELRQTLETSETRGPPGIRTREDAHEEPEWLDPKRIDDANGPTDPRSSTRRPRSQGENIKQTILRCRCTPEHQSRALLRQLSCEIPISGPTLN